MSSPILLSLFSVAATAADVYDHADSQQILASTLHINGLSHPFLAATITSFSIIVVSEIGDKTFFIAALLAMKRGALKTFAGASSALVAMTILSSFLGRVLPAILDPKYTHWASAVLFLFFGLKLLYEAWQMESNAGEPSELVEVEQELAIVHEKREPVEADLEEGGGKAKVEGLEVHSSGASAVSSRRRILLVRIWTLVTSILKTIPISAYYYLAGTAFLEAFMLTFAAEWGDRSQIATFVLGASKNIWGVNIGAILGHLACTTAAVLGGQVLASRISEKAVAYTSGATFLFFAAATIAA